MKWKNEIKIPSFFFGLVLCFIEKLKNKIKSKNYFRAPSLKMKSKSWPMKVISPRVHFCTKKEFRQNWKFPERAADNHLNFLLDIKNMKARHGERVSKSHCLNNQYVYQSLKAPKFHRNNDLWSQPIMIKTRSHSFLKGKQVKTTRVNESHTSYEIEQGRAGGSYFVIFPIILSKHIQHTGVGKEKSWKRLVGKKNGQV